jgi:hypothetical protein
MIAQNGILSPTNPIPIKYDALEKCMTYVAEILLENKTVIHAPKFGAGLARSDWKVISKMIEDIWCSKFEVIVYELPK